MRVVHASLEHGFTYPITYYGRIQAARRTPVSFEIPGRITEILVDEGEVVEEGSVVARLDTTILDSERTKLLARKSVEQTLLSRLENGERAEVIAAARATLSKLEAELEQANRDRDRIRKLRSRAAVAESEYDLALFSARSAQASRDAAQARLQELEAGSRDEDIQAQKNRLRELDAMFALLDARIKKADLLSPFRAHVVGRLVDEGVVVQEGQPVLDLSETGVYEARFSVPFALLEQAKSTFTVSVSGRKVPVQDVRTIPAVSDNTRTVDVIYVLDRNYGLVEGRTCTLDLTTQVATPCFEFPISALAPSIRGLWSVFRLEPQKGQKYFRVIREEVMVNHSDGRRVFVECALPDGALIVSEGVHKLVPGMTVRLEKGHH
ncbi:MAG: efflux RND transporter periplasmic adaptor subunit [Fuerstiella sp.]